MPRKSPGDGNSYCKGISEKVVTDSMHEFSRTQNLLDLALKKSNSKRIKRVNLLIGPFSEEREDTIRFYWKDLAKGSPGEGAEIRFEHAPIEMKCFDCSGTFSLDEEENSLCKFCFGRHLQLLEKEDVRLESIELE
jgi:Zn finger protein HypA/HybF involved in hydrogenase expression